MEENLNLKMVLNLRDNATKKLKAFNRELIKTQKLMNATQKLSLSTTSSSKGSKGGSSVGGALAGAGALGAGGAIGGGIAAGISSGSAAVQVLITAFGQLRMQMATIDSHIQHISTSMAVFSQSMAEGKSVTEAFKQIEADEIFESMADGADKATAAISKETAALRKEAKETKKSTKATNKKTKSLGGLSNAYRTLKPLIFAAIGGNVVSKIIEIGAQYQDLKTTLKIVTGSLENQAKAFQFIKKLALKLPLSVAELTEAFIRMESLGISPTEERLISFTNTASAMNKTLRQMTEAVADAATFQFERLKEFGIKAQKVGETVEFVFRNEKTVVKASSIEIVKYLEQIGDAHDGVFAGAATEKMKNFNGVLSNTKDKFATLASEIFDGGLGDGLTTLVTAAGDLALWFSSLSREARMMGVTIIHSIDWLVRGFTDKIKVLTLSVEILFSNMWTKIKNMAPIALNNIANGVKKVVEKFTDIKIDVVKVDVKPLRSYVSELGNLIEKQKEEKKIHDKAIGMWARDITATENAKQKTSDYAQTLRDQAKAAEAAAAARDKANAKLTGYAKFIKEVRDNMNNSVATQDHAKRALNELTQEYNSGTLSLRQYTQALSQLVDETGEALADTDEYTEYLKNIRDEVSSSIQDNGFAKQALSELTQEYNDGKLSLEEYSIAMNNLTDSITDVRIEDVEDDISDMTVFLQQAASNMQDALGDTFFDWMQGKTSDMVTDFKKMIDKMVAEALAAKILHAFLGDMGETGNIGGFVGDAIDGMRADGGPVGANKSYVVGEQGPELFTPKTNGTILPNDQLGQSNGGGKVVNVNITAMDSRDVQRSLEENRRYLAELVNGTNQTYNLV